MKRCVLPVLCASAALWIPDAHAYIGPGAGFAFAGSFLVLIATFALALFTVLTYPLRLAYQWLRVGNPYANAQAKRVIILGLDGMDPGILTKLMREGRVPHFSALADKGVFRPLDTSVPSMSPVAWSTFATGVDASHHNIYDFLTRDPCNYAPMLSSTDIRSAKKVLNIGRYLVPISKPRMKLLQKSQQFWKLLGDKHIFSIIQRVPITFPPVPFKNGMLLSGMCVPDLRGSQGTFSFFSTESRDGAARFTGGEQTVLRKPAGKGGEKGPNVIRSRIVGPDDAMRKAGGRMTIPFTLTVADDKRTARIEIDGVPAFDLPLREYSDWKELSFDAGLSVKVRGIARFYLMALDPEVNLYMTPIHIDPENPAMPISHPEVYAIYLAKKQGKFATLGLAEDTWSLNERVVDEKAFFDQAMLFYEERERMFLDAVKQTKKGLVTTVFDTTDRVQHMFYRYLDPTHPANAGKDTEEWKDAIFRVYERADALLGKLQAEIDDPDTAFLVISDHGFTNFRRGVNLNTWLKDNGYLFLEEGAESGDYFDGVDWTRTKAFALGLTGLFVNRKGREKSGVVAEGAEYRHLVQELAQRLEGLVDPQSGERCVRRVAVSQQFFSGPYRHDAPDLLIGWEGGYRHSWECAVGRVTDSVFSDNTKSWSGDHCVDPSIVPGVLLSNRALAKEEPRLIDIPASVMRLFGQEIPAYMQGEMIFPEGGQAPTVKGMLDPTTLAQSGSAPGARIFPLPAVREASGK